MGLEMKNRGLDASTAAAASTLTLGRARLELPNRLPTSSEAHAARTVNQRERLEGEEVFVAARLMGPDKLQEVLTKEQALQKLAQGLEQDARGAGARAKVAFLVMRGEASIEDRDQLRTLLDLQWLTGQDAILVQHGAGASSEDLVHDYQEAKRWLRERGGDKPLLPVIPPLPRREEAERLLTMLADRGAPGIALDLQGGFPYFTLRAVEAFKRKRPEVWVHAFQAPPKARFGGQRLHLGWGVALPLFGVDSFSRWVVPPPPVPVTREKINFWDPADWGVFRLKEYEGAYGAKLHCRCALCEEAGSVDDFLAAGVDPRVLLARAKTHDHLAQRAELERVQDRVREGKFGEYARRKRYARPVAETLEKPPEEA